MKILNDNYFSVNIGNLEFEIQHICIARRHEESSEPHWHTYYEIHCIMEGTSDIYIGGQKYKAKKDDIYVIPPNLTHNQEIDYNDFSESILSFSINENKNIDKKNDVQSVNEAKDIKQLFDKKKFVSYSDCFNISNEFNMIEKEIKDRKIGYYTQCKNRIINIVINMARTIDYNKKDKYKMPEKNENMRIVKLEQLLFVKENQNKSLVQLASEISISSRHLSRLIYKQYNMTHSQIINKVKIEEAKILLKNKDNTLEKISKQLNYNSVTYFLKVFKKITGHTTKFYR